MNDRPNFLWICTDQQRYDTIAALGNRYVSTPNIDRLVQTGVAFDFAYCQSPICTPSRASFLTGLYASTIRMNRNGNELFPSEAPPLVTKYLADAGFDCGLIGKLHLASASGRIEPRIDDGYRYWQYSHAPRDDWEKGHDYADWVREKGEMLGELTRSVDGVPTELHQTTWCAEKTIEFAKEKRDGPWLASVNIYDPHPPFNPPKAYRDQFDPKEMPGRCSVRRTWNSRRNSWARTFSRRVATRPTSISRARLCRAHRRRAWWKIQDRAIATRRRSRQHIMR